MRKPVTSDDRRQPSERDEAFFRGVSRILEEESDRGCILVGTAFLDVCLERMLRAHFACEAGSRKCKALEAMLRTQGPLGTMWARAQIALLADLVEDWLFHDLEVIRGLRNRCAHHLTATTFGMAEVQSEIHRLQTPGLIMDLDLPRQRSKKKKKKKSSSPSQRRICRNIFSLSVAFMAGSIVGFSDATVDLASAKKAPRNDGSREEK
jgi:DNA-binding MltR family transcriptional regulator